jgi:LysM repeat protein
MSGRGRHRRQPNRRISRRVARTSLAITAGGAGIALPFIGTGTAHAASVDKPKAAVDKPQAAVGSAKQKSGSESDKKYSVKPGDTLASISRENDTEGGWRKLYEANKEAVGSDPHLIRPGEELTLATEGSGTEPQGGEESGSEASQSSGGNYANNLDGWIREAMDVMKSHNIPGSYDGIKRNIMRESGGDPNATNNWDVNAQNGTPSQGLLQTIKPTFDAYHVEGTANSMTDPVANIVAACNYAADRYGSIDNVNGPY